LLIEPVIEALQEDSHLSREFAADVLGSYGPAARAAVPILRDYRANGDENQRLWSTLALARIEPDPSLVEPLLDLAERHSDTTTRCMALLALGGCVSFSPLCRECLDRALRDAEDRVQATARAVLESLHA
jgi:HEAT repeat protein